MREFSEKIINKMTLKEKVDALMMQEGYFCRIKRLNFEGVLLGDNPRGTDDYLIESYDRRMDDDYPIAYPQEAAVAASWNETVSFQIGRAMGKACKQRNMQVLLRPGVNIKRTPLCGRNYEYYSEDPLLSGKLGAAFIKGVQKEGTAACLKHYAVNSQEFERMTTNAIVSKRALREIYLKPFEIAIREGKPWTLMTSYNKVNGQWVPANSDLMEPLYKEYGFDGIVMSDAMAIHTEKINSHKNGLDFELDITGSHNYELKNAVEQGVIEEKLLDKSIRKMLYLKNSIDEIPTKKQDNFENEHVMARHYAAEGIVLLQNDGILPIQNQKRIGVVGRLAKEPNYMGRGSGHMNGWKVDIPYDEICELAPKDVTITYAQAYTLNENDVDEDLLKEAEEVAKKSDILLFFVGLPVGLESEGYDRTSLALPDNMRSAMEVLLALNKKVVLINISGSPVELSAYCNHVNAVVHSYLGGEAMGGAIADVLWGIEEPGGRLPETFPYKIEDTPAYLNFPSFPQIMTDVYYGEGIFVGYRWYEKRKLPVLYPFGHGLSYTDFVYSNILVEKEEYTEGDDINVTIEVENTGQRRGTQVLQLYIHEPQQYYLKPEKELKAFRKVELNPGEKKKVLLSVNANDLGSFDEEHDRWIRECGKYNILVGVSSENIILKKEFYFYGKKNPKKINSMTAVEWINKNPNISRILKDKSIAAKKYLGNLDKTKESFTEGLPVYRFTEKLIINNDTITREELSEIIEELNDKQKR